MNNWKNILDYIDSMLVVDKHLKILHANRFSSRFNKWIIENNYEEEQVRTMGSLHLDQYSREELMAIL